MSAELIQHVVAKDAGVDASTLMLDGTVAFGSKVGWYRDRVEAWQRGEKVAPITIDCATTRSCQAACIGPDELVSMADGSLKKMKDVRSGNIVVSFDGNVISSSLVLNSWLTKSQAKTISIVTVDGNMLRCTEDHKILTVNGWVEAGKLCIGDYLVTEEENIRKTISADYSPRPFYEGEKERPDVRGAETNSRREEQGMVGERCFDKVERRGAPTSYQLQQKSRKDKGASLARGQKEAWGKTDYRKQDEGMDRGTEVGECETFAGKDSLRSMSERPIIGAGKRGYSPENDWQSIRPWSFNERGEQEKTQREDEIKESYEGSKNGREDESNDRGAVRQRLLRESIQTIEREWASWQIIQGNVQRGSKTSHQRTHEGGQSDEAPGGCGKGDEVFSGAWSSGDAFRKNEKEVGRWQDRTINVPWVWVSERGEQNGIDAISHSREISREIRGQRQILVKDYDKRNLQEPGFYFWGREEQNGPTSSWGILASRSGCCGDRDGGLFGCRMESVSDMDKKDVELDAPRNRKRSGFVVSRVCRIINSGLSPVYDLECYPHHNFIAGGVVVHNCSWCFSQSQASEGNTITKEHFFHFLEDAAEIGVKGISLISDGESTLSPWYADAIEYGHSLGLAIGAGSNGIKLTKPILERVLPKLTYLRFNFSAGEPKRYAEIMGLNQHFFHVVKQNMLDGMEIIRRDGLKCSLNMQIVLDPRDGDQIIPFAKLACEVRPVYAIIKHCSENDERTFGIDYSRYDALEGDLREAERLGKETGIRIAVKWDKIKTGWNRAYDRCLGANFIMQISGNGTVGPCGMKFNEKHKALHLGSITRTRFKDIWASDRWTEVMSYLASEHFDPRQRCGSLCLQHSTNNFLYEYVNGRVSLPTSPPPQDLAFI